MYIEFATSVNQLWGLDFSYGSEKINSIHVNSNINGLTPQKSKPS